MGYGDMDGYGQASGSTVRRQGRGRGNEWQIRNMCKILSTLGPATAGQKTRVGERRVGAGVGCDQTLFG